ncbi:MAG: HipA domain-containing protein [Thermodesulfobacteriota bacterium]|nr:HipA domain-containing protein [Thermodesulfobacteriota bacterium]
MLPKTLWNGKTPKVPFSTPDIAIEAQKMVGRMSISGIQPKLSLIHERKSHQLTVVETGGSYILKPQTERFESLPENENLCICIASSCGIAVPSHGLRVRSKITLHFKRRCIPSGCVPKVQQYLDIPNLSRLASQAPQHLKLPIYF